MGSRWLKIIIALVAIVLAFIFPGLKRGEAMVTPNNFRSLHYYQDSMDRSACYNFFVYQGSQGLRFSCSYADRQKPEIRYELEDVQIQQEDITKLLTFLQTLHWEQQTKLQKAINKLHAAMTKDVVVLDGGSSRLELCTRDEKFTLPAGGAYTDELWRLLDALRMKAEQADKAVGDASS
jgi:hypothetical protein